MSDPAPFHVANSRVTDQKSISTSKLWPEQQNGSWNVPHSPGTRAKSPDARSTISAEDYHPFHVQEPACFAVLGQKNTPTTWLERLSALWLRNRGLGLVLSAQIFGTAMNVTTRIMEVDGNHGKGYHPFQILFPRMCITLLFSASYCRWNKIEHFPFGAKNVRWLLVLRGLGGFFGVFGMYYSLLYLPLADATVITFLAPSIANLACSITMHEPFTRLEQIAALVSLLGVVLIARPTTLFANSASNPDATPVPAISNTTATTTEDPSYLTATPAQRFTAILIALLGVLGAACAYTTLRAIGPTTHPLISVNYFSVFCILISLIPLLFVPSIPFLLPVSVADWGWLTLLGSSGFVMQFLLATGLQSERGGRATGMVYAQMVFAAGADRWVFGTRMGWVSGVGCGLIVGSAVVVAVRKERGDSEKREPGGQVGQEGDEEMGLVVSMHVSEGVGASTQGVGGDEGLHRDIDNEQAQIPA